MKKCNGNTHFGSKIAGMTREGPRAGVDFFVYHLLHKKYVNVKISLRTVNSQLYQIKELENDFRCRFETNSAAKQNKRIRTYHSANIRGENTAVVRVFPPFF